MILTEKYEKEIKEALAKSTKVVGWYPYSQFDGYHLGKASVRGPFGRWLLVEGGDNGMGDPINHPTPVADLFDDAIYAAIAMNSVPILLNEIEKLRNLVDLNANACEALSQEIDRLKMRRSTSV